MSSFDKRLPKAPEAERALLGCVLVNNAVMVELAHAITPDDFYSSKHEEIWRAMLDLFERGKTIDLVTLSDYMKNESESSLYLSGLYDDVPHSAYASQYAEQVKSTSRRRNIISAASRIVAAAYEENDPSIAEEEARAILEKAIEAQSGDDLLTPAVQAGILKRYFDNLSSGDPSQFALQTGFFSIDSMCGGGLRRGNLVIVAARTSVGKSTFAECIAENVANHGKHVLFVSLEMSPDEMMFRYAVRSGALSESATSFGIDNDTDKEALENLAKQRIELPFYLLNAPSATTTRIRAAITRMQLKGVPPDLIVVDYLQLLKDAGRQEERLRIGEITSTMKAIAGEFSAPVIMLSQLNRNIEMRGGEPRLADLLESGRIEADADVVIMLWQTDKPDPLGNVTYAKIAKNRMGATGKLPIIFNKPQFRFAERQSDGK